MAFAHRVDNNKNNGDSWVYTDNNFTVFIINRIWSEETVSDEHYLCLNARQLVIS